MAIVCNPQTLIASGACLDCLPEGEKMLARLALLVRILKQRNPAYVLNVQQLVSSASCFECLLSNPDMMQLAKLSLLCRIRNQ